MYAFTLLCAGNSCPWPVFPKLIILKFGIRQALFRFIERNMYIYHSFNGHCIFNEIIRIHFNFVAASNAGMILYLCMTTTNDYLTLYRGKYYIISVI